MLMHGLWIQMSGQILLLIVQAVMVTGTILLHRVTKAVEGIIQAHMTNLENMLNEMDTIKRP